MKEIVRISRVYMAKEEEQQKGHSNTLPMNEGSKIRRRK